MGYAVISRRATKRRKRQAAIPGRLDEIVYARHGRELIRLKSSVCEPRYYDSMVAKLLAEGKRLRLAVASQEGVIVRWCLKEAGV